MRLNVFLQRAGIGSRREAERIVAEGRVSVDGVIATGTTPVEENSTVNLDGKPIAIETRSLPRLFLFNKPLDVLVSAKDPQGRPTIYDLPALKDKSLPRLMYVGRLDVNSEGLLVLSDDGALAQKMTDPDTALPRVYRVRAHGKLSARDLGQIRNGVTVEGIRYRPAEIEEEVDKGGRTNAWYKVTLFEGKNREIRRLMTHFGCVVNRLIRIQYGPFHLESLERGDLKEVAPNIVEKAIQAFNQPTQVDRPASRKPKQ